MKIFLFWCFVVFVDELYFLWVVEKFGILFVLLYILIDKFEVEVGYLFVNCEG